MCFIFEDEEGLQKLFDALKRQMLLHKIETNDFCQYVLNIPKSTWLNYVTFKKRNVNSMSVIHVNAIYNWIHDEKRLEKFERTKKTGQFSFLNDNILEANVLKLFDV